MDQKNTIVKCKAHPNCLFNHNGVCDNYVINISTDGKCESYIETTFTTENSQWNETFIEEIKRGQRAKCNVFDDMMDIDDKHLGETVIVKMKIAELNKPNKNQSISDWYYAATLDTCKTCKKVVYGQPCKYKNVINGVWTCYEEATDEI